MLEPVTRHEQKTVHDVSVRQFLYAEHRSCRSHRGRSSGPLIIVPNAHHQCSGLAVELYETPTTMRDLPATLLFKKPLPSALLGLSASLAVASCLYLSICHGRNVEAIIDSPLSRVRKLPRSQQLRLPYPPEDVFPGSRDVSSPYGSIRVYEWGPKDGRKVLLVHGITTPGIALGPLAEGLANSGCRVMLFGGFHTSVSRSYWSVF